MYYSFLLTDFVKYRNEESGSIAKSRGRYNLIALLADYTIMGTFDSLCKRWLTLERF